MSESAPSEVTTATATMCFLGGVFLLPAGAMAYGLGRTIDTKMFVLTGLSSKVLAAILFITTFALTHNPHVSAKGFITWHVFGYISGIISVIGGAIALITVLTAPKNQSEICATKKYCNWVYIELIATAAALVGGASSGLIMTFFVVNRVFMNMSNASTVNVSGTALNTQFTSLKTDVDEECLDNVAILDARVAAVETGIVDTVEKYFETVETSVEKLKEQVETVETGVEKLKGQVETVETDVATLKEGTS